jgi:hypothetical protein
MDDIARLWTHEETAKYLHVSSWTLAHLIAENAGPTEFRVGRNRRYDPFDVRSWLYLTAAEVSGQRPEAGRHARPDNDDDLGNGVEPDDGQNAAIDPGPVT